MPDVGQLLQAFVSPAIFVSAAALLLKAEKLSKLYYANLLRKLNEGKSLSDKEFKHLQSLADAPSSPTSAKGRNVSQIKRSL